MGNRLPHHPNRMWGARFATIAAIAVKVVSYLAFAEYPQPVQELLLGFGLGWVTPQAASNRHAAKRLHPARGDRPPIVEQNIGGSRRVSAARRAMQERQRLQLKLGGQQPVLLQASYHRQSKPRGRQETGQSPENRQPLAALRHRDQIYLRVTASCSLSERRPSCAHLDSLLQSDSSVGRSQSRSCCPITPSECGRAALCRKVS
jgi:hypothetical protein